MMRGKEGKGQIAYGDEIKYICDRYRFLMSEWVLSISKKLLLVFIENARRKLGRGKSKC